MRRLEQENAQLRNSVQSFERLEELEPFLEIAREMQEAVLGRLSLLGINGVHEGSELFDLAVAGVKQRHEDELMASLIEEQTEIIRPTLVESARAMLQIERADEIEELANELLARPEVKALIEQEALGSLADKIRNKRVEQYESAYANSLDAHIEEELIRALLLLN